MSAAPRHAPAASAVLLVIAGPAVSHAAIARTAELAAGSVVTVIGVGSEQPPGADGAVPEQVRRTVALAMSALDDAGVTALGRIALTGSPVRAIARAARARGVRVVVLDEAGPPAGPGVGSGVGSGDGGLAAELRRRMYGSGIVVMAPSDHGGRRVVRS